MPIYDYKCKKCGHVFEVTHSINSKDEYSCPSCLHKKTNRIISRSSFILKGDGWYKDHYGLKGNKSNE